jgi:hypothetical protein
VLGGQVARHGQAGPHRPLGVGGDDRQAGAGRLVDDRRVADLDAELLELLLVEQAVAVVAEAADERPFAAELGQGDDRVGDRPAAGQPGVAGVEAVEQLLLLGPLDEPHRPFFQREAGEVGVGQFEEDIDERVAQPADVELFHGSDPGWGSGSGSDSRSSERMTSSMRASWANGTMPPTVSTADAGTVTSHVQTTAARRFNFVRGCPSCCHGSSTVTAGGDCSTRESHRGDDDLPVRPDVPRRRDDDRGARFRVSALRVENFDPHDPPLL